MSSFSDHSLNQSSDIISRTPVKYGWWLSLDQITYCESTFVAGVPKYRTRVLYIPQRPSLLPGTPRAFLETVQGFNSRRSSSGRDAKHENPIDIAHSWGLPSDVWDRAWSTLSGGEAQRISLAIGVGISGAEIVLLDGESQNPTRLPTQHPSLEPTSALDEETSRIVEKTLIDLVNSESSIKALIWITHNAAQEQRVATRSISLSNGRLSVEEDGASENV